MRSVFLLVLQIGASSIAMRQDSCPPLRLVQPRLSTPVGSPVVWVRESTRVSIGPLGGGVERVPWVDSVSVVLAAGFREKQRLGLLVELAGLASFAVWFRENFNGSGQINADANKWLAVTLTWSALDAWLHRSAARNLRSAVGHQNARCG